MGRNIFEKKSFRGKVRIFRDREDAGNMLGDMLDRYRESKGVVFAIPAGGVPVAARVAGKLNLALDVCAVSKITLPWNSEAGYGAVAFDGTVRLNSKMLLHFKTLHGEVEKGIEETKKKVMRRVNTLRGPGPIPDLSGRPAILVDDGVASGFTMHVAILALKNEGAARIIIAVPTGHLDTVNRLAEEVDAVYCPNVRGAHSFAVADAYEMWCDVSDEEAIRILRGG